MIIKNITLSCVARLSHSNPSSSSTLSGVQTNVLSSASSAVCLIAPAICTQIVVDTCRGRGGGWSSGIVNVDRAGAVAERARQRGTGRLVTRRRCMMRDFDLIVLEILSFVLYRSLWSSLDVVQQTAKLTPTTTFIFLRNARSLITRLEGTVRPNGGEQQAAVSKQQMQFFYANNVWVISNRIVNFT